jgi:tRNA threonylcarbamoyladenosine biosynthesis protein TsaE
MLDLESPEATRAAGAELGRALAAASDGKPWLVGLEGELGAGKTTFVAGLLSALGHAGAVRSPTYTFVEPYRLAGRSIHHCDLYRIKNAEEIEDLGMRELASGDALLLVEWPSRAAGRLGVFDLTVQLEYAQDGDTRRISVGAGTRRGASVLEGTGSTAHYIPTLSS